MIVDICEDKFGSLWISTEDGLNRFNKIENKFYRYVHKNNDSLSIPSNKVLPLLLDKKGDLWIGTYGKGLCKYNYISDSFEHYPLFKDNSKSPPKNIIYSLFEDKKGNLWVGTSFGLLNFNIQNNKYEFQKLLENKASNIAFPVYSIIEDKSGNLLLVCGSYGIVKYNPIKKTVSRKLVKIPDKGHNEWIVKLFIDSKANLWVGTMGGGVLLFNKGSNHFKIIKNDRLKLNSLSDNNVISILEDNSGIMWFGTALGGVNKLISDKKKFKLYRKEIGSANSLTSNMISSVYEDGAGYLWIGTRDGLNRINKKNGRVLHYYHIKNEPGSLSGNFITAIAEDNKSNLWIGTDNGINKYDRQKNKFKAYKHNYESGDGLSAKFISAIHIDGSGYIWIGTRGGGLNKFHPDTSKFTYYKFNPDDNNSLNSNNISALYEDRNGSLWIGTESGASKFDKTNGKFTRFISKGQKPYCLSNDYIMSFYEDSSGYIWIGTYGGGLNKLDPKTGYIKHFSEAEGLPNNVVYGILPDDEGNLWLSTNKGLCKFNIKTSKTRSYDFYDGLQSYEFNGGAYFKSKKGELFFGGINGLNSFFPSQIIDHTHIPSVVIISFKKLDNDINFNKKYLNAEPVELSYNENYVSFEFVALDYTNPKKNKYAYLLKDVDKDWVYCGARRFASYTNLEPGTYTFKVKAANSDEVWNEQGTQIMFTIYPPFWKTWWFSVIVMVITGVVLVTIHKYRVRAKINRIVEIEKVRKRIADDFHDELGHKLTKIALYSELMQRNLNNGMKNSSDYLKKISASANSLYDDTKDFIWSLDPGKDSLYDLAVYLKDFGDELFDKTGFAFRVTQISDRLLNVYIPMDWKRQIILLFKEAMNNILRHSGGSNVNLSVELKDKNIEIVLQDDGHGFDNNTESKGRGISNMKHRAKLIGGELYLISENDKGVTVKLLKNLSEYSAYVRQNN